jgi:carboxyl-terminal processing protease
MKTNNDPSLVKLVFLVSFIFAFGSIQAKEGELLAEYIRVWSVVKYYSPFEVDSKPNLDSVFQQQVKIIFAKKTVIAFNRQIRKMLKYSSGMLIAGVQPETDLLRIEKIDSINCWLYTDSILSEENRAKLIQLIHLRRDTVSPFFKSSSTFNVLLTNEKRYLAAFPPIEIRLLAVAHYWSVINFFFPYKSLIEYNWDRIPSLYCEQILTNKNELDFHQTLRRLTTEIRDGHGSLQSLIIDKKYGFFQLPCEVANIQD